jgi:methyl-accepting chemotaxis protein
MTWTVGRRIGLGTAAFFLLIALIAAVGTTALPRVSQSYRSVIESRAADLGDALRAQVSASRGNTAFLRHLLGDGLERVAEWERYVDDAARRLSELGRRAPDRDVEAGWQRAADLLDQYRQASSRAIAAKRDGAEEEAKRIRTDEVLPVRERLFAEIDDLISQEDQLADEVTAAADRFASAAFWFISVTTVATLLAGALIAWALARMVTRPLREAIGTLASASSEIVAATTQQASGAAEEAAAVQQTSATVNQVRQTTQLSSQKARAVAESTQKTAQISQDGRQAVEQSVRAIEEAKERMEQIAERILTLSEQGHAIGEIIAVVNDLADQSNILAVNASIEAAKAGEAGKGFTVVAAEVRALAEQSKQATAQVRGILNEIQKATQAAVMAAEQGVKASAAGVGVAGRADEAIRFLADSLTESAQAAQQILASSQQQVAGVDQIALAMENIQQSSSQNMASTRQVERAAHDLSQLAGRLTALVSGAGTNGPRHLGDGT